MDFDKLKREIDEIVDTSSSRVELMKRVCEKLHTIPKYNWVGFYMIDQHEPGYLVLEQYQGPPTIHTRIPMDQGICGAAASSGQVINVPDVSKDSRFLSCSDKTNSEVVVPVFGHGNLVVGELDIDSYRLSAFQEADVEFLKDCANKVGSFLENHGQQRIS